MEPIEKSIGVPAPRVDVLVSGARMMLRMWTHASRTKDRVMHSRPYETVGYVLEGRARLHIATSIMALGPGDSYVVPAHAEHAYEVVRAPFRCVEAISPPPP